MQMLISKMNYPSNMDDCGRNSYMANAQSCNVYANVLTAAAVQSSQQHSIDMILGAQRILQNEFEKTFPNCDFLPSPNTLGLNHVQPNNRKGN
jgi:hypothetical protein